MRGISAVLAVVALAVAPAPVAADPAVPAPTLPERPGLHKTQHDVEADETMAIVLGAVLLFVVIAGPLFGVDSRPAWRRVDRKPRFRMVGSMRPEDWPPA
jgi:hypothetical protein